MFTKRTIIGIAVGAVIIGIGSAGVVVKLFYPLDVEEVIEPGETATYSIMGRDGTTQYVTIRGDRFDFSANVPGEGTTLNGTYEGTHEFEWTQTSDGVSRATVKNTGQAALDMSAVFTDTDPIWIIHSGIVITTGVVIAGFSLTFSIRRPRGF